MLAPSRSRAPLAFVALARSEPARSIRLILAIQTLWLRLAVLSCCLKNIWEKKKHVAVSYVVIYNLNLKDVTNCPTEIDCFASV